MEYQMVVSLLYFAVFVTDFYPQMVMEEGFTIVLVLYSYLDLGDVLQFIPFAWSREKIYPY